jgi:membrane protein DedA with SNARE-associated domain/membrane-associated phospholipid phosphatase
VLQNDPLSRSSVQSPTPSPLPLSPRKKRSGRGDHFNGTALDEVVISIANLVLALYNFLIMLEHSFRSLVHFLQGHPHWGGLITFIVSLIESLAVIGTIVPGSVTMTGIGALVGSGVLPSTATFIWAIAGAYTGDCISYGIGIYYNERLRTIWPFNKHSKWLQMGEDFFRQHGGKGVVIGRFVGPIRSLIPMIAGLLKMRPSRFLPFAFVSATLWAIVYMMPGVILGALAAKLPPKVATQFVLLFLLAIALLWGLIWLIKYFIETCWGQIDRLFMNLWNYLNVHQRSHWVTQLLRNPAHEEDHLQLALAVGFIIMSVLFLWIMLDVMMHGFLMHLNFPFFNLLQSFRLKPLDQFTLIMTLLGYVKLLLSVAAVILVVLLLQRQFWTAWHWLAIILISAGITDILKKWVHEPRPPLVQESIHTGAFPSGHVTLSTALFGFLAVIIAYHLPAHRRALPYWYTAILVALIAFSRVYLGAHWLTDILGGISLGLACVLLVTLSYRRRTPSALSPIKFSIVIGIIFLLAWLGFGITHFKSFQQQFTPFVPVETILNPALWWQQTAGELPLYRTNRTGSPSQPLNIQWLGSLLTIEQTLERQGWQNQAPNPNLNRTLLQLSNKSSQDHLPLLPSLYHNRHPELLMTKSNGANRPILVLRLWRSDILMKTDTAALWMGQIQFYVPPKLLHVTSRQQKIEDLQNTIEALTPYLKDFQWHIIAVPTNQQPSTIQHLHWDGKVLLIKEKDLFSSPIK